MVLSIWTPHPANVLITDSGSLKLGDFGLLLDLSQKSTGHQGDKGKDDVHEGDPRYMAPELLRGENGPAADVFSLGVTILELTCNIEVPNGGEGWQQLRQGCLPLEFTSGLSTELQTVLQMMLTSEPSKRPTVSELLACACVRKRTWKRRICLMATEIVLSLFSLSQFVVCFGCRLLSSLHLSFPHWSKPVPWTPPRDSWDRNLTLPLSAMQVDSGSPEDDGVFLLAPSTSEPSPTFSHSVKSRLSVQRISTPLPGSPHNRQSLAHTPTYSVLDDWSSHNLTPSSIHSNRSCHTLTPSASPIHADHHITSSVDINENTAQSHNPSSSKFSKRLAHTWVLAEEVLPRPNIEPNNLLSLFEETTSEGQP